MSLQLFIIDNSYMNISPSTLDQEIRALQGLFLVNSKTIYPTKRQLWLQPRLSQKKLQLPPSNGQSI